MSEETKRLHQELDGVLRTAEMLIAEIESNWVKEEHHTAAGDALHLRARVLKLRAAFIHLCYGEHTNCGPNHHTESDDE